MGVQNCVVIAGSHCWCVRKNARQTHTGAFDFSVFSTGQPLNFRNELLLAKLRGNTQEYEALFARYLQQRSAKTSAAKREAGEAGCRKRKAAGGENGDPNKKGGSRAQQQAAGQAGSRAGGVEQKRKAGEAGSRAGGIEQKRKAGEAGNVELKRKAGGAGGRTSGTSRATSRVSAAATAIRTSCNKGPRRRSRASLTSSTELRAWWANL